MKEWTSPDCRNTPSTVNLEEEEIVDAPGNDDNASMPKQVKRPNPWRKMMKSKTIPLQAWICPEGSRSLRLPDFKTVGT